MAVLVAATAVALTLSARSANAHCQNTGSGHVCLSASWSQIGGGPYSYQWGATAVCDPGGSGNLCIQSATVVEARLYTSLTPNGYGGYWTANEYANGDKWILYASDQRRQDCPENVNTEMVRISLYKLDGTPNDGPHSTPLQLAYCHHNGKN